MNNLLFNSKSAGYLIALFVCLALTTSCARQTQRTPIDANAYARELEQWQAKRVAELTGDGGWLTLIGLYWLKDGPNSLGLENDNDIVLNVSPSTPLPINRTSSRPEKTPRLLGSFLLANGVVRFETPLAQTFFVDKKPVTSVDFKTDGEDKPTVMYLGSVSFQIIKRGDKFGLRMKDAMNPDRLNFKGTQFYPTNLAWRIEARFEPYNPPKPMPIMNVLGMESAESSPGAILFEVDGQEYRLDAMTEKGDQRFFMLIGDKTNGKTTYPAGRYLYVDPPDAAGHVIIDFNKIFSPPCAFTKFATCPLPPKQNRLPIQIEAGEKYEKHSAKTGAQASRLLF